MDCGRQTGEVKAKTGEKQAKHTYGEANRREEGDSGKGKRGKGKRFTPHEPAHAEAHRHHCL
jgi:hypothetical protein